MKSIRTAAIAALLSTSLMSTPALATTFADGTADIETPTPAGITDAAAQAVCTTLASNHGGTAPYVFHGTLEQGSISGEVVGTPTLNGTRSASTNVTGTGTQVPDTIQVKTDPFRVGGSVNMFGMAGVVAAHWTDSEYDFTAPYAWTSDYSFTCNMTETVLVPETGHHVWQGPPTATEPQQACEAADNNVHFDTDQGQCKFVVDVAAHNEDEARNDEAGSITGVSENGTLNGHENHGGPIPVDPNEVTAPDVQVVICISPSTTTKKLPGAWTAKNGYSGGAMGSAAAANKPGCSTLWYNGGGLTQSPYSNVNTGSNNVVTIPSS